MAVWTVLEPDDTDELAGADWADRVVLVREAMCWSAILLAPLVLLRHRLWFAFVVYLVVQGLVAFALYRLEPGDGGALLMLFANLAVAVELPALRRRKLVARGFEETGAVVARTLEEAEQRYFEGRLAGAGWSRSLAGPVLGLFPEASPR